MNSRRAPNGSAWRRWHRILGLTSAAFVLLLAVTGLLINHTGALGLDRQYIASDWLLKVYGVKPADDVVVYRAGADWVSWLDGRLFLGSEMISSHWARPRGAVAAGPLRAIAGDGEVAVHLGDGRLVERLGASAGVPGDLRRIGLTGSGRVAIDTGHGVLVGDDALTRFQPVGDAPRVEWSEPATPPAGLREELEAAWRGRGLPVERVLLDLHSGRILGPVGVWLVDAMALIFLVLSVSGLWLWWRRRGNGRPGRLDRSN